MPQLWLTEEADVRCGHPGGTSPQRASQHWVTIDSKPVLVAPDPVGRPIVGCTFRNVSIKPCQRTLAMNAGDSSWVRIDGRPVVRADLSGFTDGTPPGAVTYEVVWPGQQLIEETP